DPRHKEIIPREHRPLGLPATLDEAAMQRVREHIVAARAAKLGQSATERKISPLLSDAAASQPAGRMAIAAAAPANPLLSYTADGEVRLELRMREVTAQNRRALGESVRVTGVDAPRGRVFVSVAPGGLDAALQALAARADVLSIRTVIGGVTRVGSQQTEGDAAHRANKARKTLKVNGHGVRLCAISDGIQN